MDVSSSSLSLVFETRARGHDDRAARRRGLVTVEACRDCSSADAAVRSCSPGRTQRCRGRLRPRCVRVELPAVLDADGLRRMRASSRDLQRIAAAPGRVPPTKGSSAACSAPRARWRRAARQRARPPGRQPRSSCSKGDDTLIATERSLAVSSGATGPCDADGRVLRRDRRTVAARVEPFVRRQRVSVCTRSRHPPADRHAVTG